MIYVIKYNPQGRSLILFYSNDIEKSIDYYSKNTATNKNLVRKQIRSYNYHNKGEIYLIDETNKDNYFKFFGIKTGAIRDIEDIIKTHIRTILIDNIIKV